MTTAHSACRRDGQYAAKRAVDSALRVLNGDGPSLNAGIWFNPYPRFLQWRRQENARIIGVNLRCDPPRVPCSRSIQRLVKGISNETRERAADELVVCGLPRRAPWPRHRQTTHSARARKPSARVALTRPRSGFRLQSRPIPTIQTARMELGVAQLRLGRPGEAAGILQQGRRAKPADAGRQPVSRHRLRADAPRRGGGCGARRETELDPKNAQAWMWQGVVELQDGHPEKATEPFDRAAELAPNDLNILEYRGKAHSEVAFASYARMAVHRSDFVACPSRAGADVLAAKSAQGSHRRIS